MNLSLTEMFVFSLTPSLGILFFLAGLHSLIFNVRYAKTNNQPRNEQVARIGGWLYISTGVLILIMQFFL